MAGASPQHLYLNYVVKRDGIDLNKTWGPGARGYGKDDKICGFMVNHCPDTYDWYSVDYICSKTYEWFMETQDQMTASD